jgi:hypothetical protein
LEDRREQTPKGKHCTSEELGSSNHHQGEAKKRSDKRSDKRSEARRRTALKKIMSMRVVCLRTAASTIAKATSLGLSVLEA